MEIKEQIKQKRKEFGLTQTEFARLLGVDYTTVSRIERGVYNPSYAFIQKFEELCKEESKETVDMPKYTKEAMKFLDSCPSAFHSVDSISKHLLKNGFIELVESEPMKVEKGNKYFIARNGTSIIAFDIGNFKDSDVAFNIVASHSDSPSFKVKPNNNIKGDHCSKLSVEAYGGMLCAPWFDRPLSVAGRVLVQAEEGLKQELVNVDKNLLIIPNVAIHMNREANSGYRYNFAVDMQPLLSLDPNVTLEDILAKQLKVEKENILSHDLYLYVREKAQLCGADDELILAPHLDDLQCAFGTLLGFEQGHNDDSINVYCCFDNEEVGSCTRQGAASTFLFDILNRVSTSLGLSEDDFRKALASSFMVSADNAHAVHPNHPEYADALNRVYMNQGIVVKFNAAQSYTSDGLSCAYFKNICQKANVPVQIFTNRADLRGGGTLGNISTSQVSIMSVDIGMPQLAMHSCYESAGVKDLDFLVAAMKEFFSSAIRVDKSGSIIYK